METLEFKRKWFKVEIDVTDISADEFAEKSIELMQSIWYSDDSIRKAIDKISF